MGPEIELSSKTNPLENEQESPMIEKKVDEITNSKIACKWKNANNDSVEKAKIELNLLSEELLGSVTTSNSPGVRTSARVIQKMKQDSIRSVTPPPSAHDKKDSAKEEKAHHQKTPNQAKPQKIVWTNSERLLFFDAINEFGKEFDAIANFLNAKMKRKTGLEQPQRTKEQVRVLYYQTFHKISKYIKFSDEVKKPVQELYALINYGEMRRKLIFVSEKNCRKIKELVYKGQLIVRSKGKNVRIKTPLCKALRRLNQLEDLQEDIKLPYKIEVYLRPSTMDAWGRVQNTAQNPNVKTFVSLQKKLVDLIKTFQHRWRTQDTVLKEQAIRLLAASTIKSDTKLLNSLDNSDLTYYGPQICMHPSPNITIHRPLVSVREMLSNQSVCLNSYEQKLGVKTRGETLCGDSFFQLPNKRQRTDSGCGSSDKKSPEAKKGKCELFDVKPLDSFCDKEESKCEEEVLSGCEVELITERLAKTSSQEDLMMQEDLGDILNDVGNQNGFKFERLNSSNSNGATDIDLEVCKNDEPAEHKQCSKITSFLGQIPGGESSAITIQQSAGLVNSFSHTNTAVTVKTHRKKKKEKDIKKDMLNAKPLITEEAIHEIRKGWTLTNAGDITIGDLYIMFGQDSKVMLEYSWLDSLPEKGVAEVLTTNATACNLNNNETEIVKSVHHNRGLGNKLKNLLTIANLSERLRKKQCSCINCGDKSARQKSESYVSSKTYVGAHKDFGLFRQPMVPFRRNAITQMEIMQNGTRFRQSRIIHSRKLQSKQIVVQRLLPVQPGLDSSVHFQKFDVDMINKIDDEDQNRQKQLMSNDKNKNDVETSKLSLFKFSGENKVSATVVKNNSVPAENQLVGFNPDGIRSCTLAEPTNSLRLDEDPGIRQLMEISLPSPIHSGVLDGDNFYNLPPMSPMRLLRESSENSKWLDEDINDFSLSSFLGHLEEINRDMPNDISNISTITESNMDYITDFTGITASIKDKGLQTD